MGFFSTAKPKVKSISTLTGGQEDLMSVLEQAIKSGEGPLADIFGQFNEQNFKQGVEQPAIRQFQEQILPMIQEQYVARGQTGGSAMRRGQNKALTDLQSYLSGLKYQAQQDQLKNRIQGLQLNLGTKAKENLVLGGQEGMGVGILKGLSQGLGEGTGAAVTGGAGSAASKASRSPAAQETFAAPQFQGGSGKFGLPNAFEIG